MQEVHQQELGASQAGQSNSQDTQDEVQRLTSQLASQERQTQQVSCAAVAACSCWLRHQTGRQPSPLERV